MGSSSCTKIKKKMYSTGAGFLLKQEKKNASFSNQLNDVSDNAVPFINVVPFHIRKSTGNN